MNAGAANTAFAQLTTLHISQPQYECEQEHFGVHDRR